ncbi:MAG: small basic protein [Planctomycetes bacterium]|nr:small basic protein [Planctomycetota bacterium]
MSIHSSLKTSAGGKGSRSVWTRIERLAVLKKEGRWSEGESVLGLPKVRTKFKLKTKKQLKAEAAAARETGTPEAKKS